jgi:hypothetical protein
MPAMNCCCSPASLVHTLEPVERRVIGPRCLVDTGHANEAAGGTARRGRPVNPRHIDESRRREEVARSIETAAASKSRRRQPSSSPDPPARRRWPGASGPISHCDRADRQSSSAAITFGKPAHELAGDGVVDDESPRHDWPLVTTRLDCSGDRLRQIR